MITETKNYILSYKNKDYIINILSDFLVLKHKENHIASIYKNDDIDTNTLKNIKDIYYSGNTILYKDFNDKYYLWVDNIINDMVNINITINKFNYKLLFDNKTLIYGLINGYYLIINEDTYTKS